MTAAGASLASIDGEIITASEAMIPATDDGLVRGDGIFEVVRVYDGRPFALDEHLLRLARSAQNMRLPADIEAVRSDAHRLLARAGIGPAHAVLRIILTRGGRRVLLTEPLPSIGSRVRLATVTYSPPRVLDGVKSLSYGANMLASRLARERGFDEALLVTPHGRVLEAPTASIFWVRDGKVFTPPLSEHILASITRRLVMEHAGGAERLCPLEELLAADEAFLASTVREVQGVAAVEDREFQDGPLTERLAGEVRARISEELQQG